MRSEVLSAVLAAVDTTWRSATEIHDRVGCWARQSVSTKLNELAEAGDIQREQTQTPQGFRWVYRKVAS